MPETPQDRLRRAIDGALDDTVRASAQERLARYRPDLAVLVGEDIAGRVLTDAALLDTAVALEDVADADEVARAAAEHLRDTPGATVDDALAAARAALR